MEWTRYIDPFDQWVCVSHEAVLDYGFEDRVESDNTRMSPSWVYLHGEDGQAFLEAVEKADGSVSVREHRAENRSTLRYLPRYRKDFLCLVPTLGRRFRFTDSGDDWEIVEERYNARAGGQVLIKRVGETP